MNSISQKNNTKNLLWTGGWDSTFTLMILFEEGVTVQPYYIIDKQRLSCKIEIKKMDAIRVAIKDKYPSKWGLMLPTIYIDMEDIKIDESIYKKYQNISKYNALGSQYIWLASYAKNSGIEGLQLSVQRRLKDVDSIIIPLLGDHINKNNDNTTLPYWEIVDVTDDMDISIFQYFHFPILEYTKLDMLQISKEKGFFDILNLSWFCHKPIHNKPCGICNPCKTAIEEGLSERLPSEAIRRYRYKTIYYCYFKITKKLQNILCRD